MIKKNKRILIITSIVILLPAVLGLLLWNMLPQRMATHWGLSGAVDGWSGKLFSVVAMPLFMLAMHWFCIAVTAADPKNKNQTKKAIRLIFWICPVISLYSSGMIYAAALGLEFDISTLVLAASGLTFILFGNYLPKCRQNHTLGIRIKWTLENEENWNATHRFCGKLWMAGGILIMAGCLLPSRTTAWIVMGILIPAMVVIPFVYSWLYHRKQKENGTDTVTSSASAANANQKRTAKISLAITAVILLGCIVLLFTGNIRMQYDDRSFTIHASYWPDLTVNYEDIESLEYRDQAVKGIRTNGLGSPRLLAGAFSNEEFGSYTRYTYTKCSSSVVLKVKDSTLVISGIDEKDTKEIYEELEKRISSP